MAPHSSPLAWKIPWMAEPGGPQSMGSLRVGHDSATSPSLFTFMHRRRKWQPTPAPLPGKSHGRRRVVGYSPWGRKESDTTERLHFHFSKLLIQFPVDGWSCVPSLLFTWAQTLVEVMKTMVTSFKRSHTYGGDW